MFARLNPVCLAALVAASAFAQKSDPKTDGKYRGSFESNFTFINSNKRTENFLFVGNAKSLRTRDRLLLDGYYNFARQTDSTDIFQTSSDMWSLGGRYERDFGRNSFWYTSGRLERDGVNLLDLRTIGGAGVGYTVNQNWRVSGGASYVNEDYRNSTNSFWGFEFQSAYDKDITEKVSLSHTFVVIPNFADLSDYYFKSNFGVSYKLAANFSAGFRYIVGFDSTPPAGSLKQSTTYAFVFRYSF